MSSLCHPCTVSKPPLCRIYATLVLCPCHHYVVSMPPLYCVCATIMSCLCHPCTVSMPPLCCLYATLILCLCHHYVVSMPPLYCVTVSMPPSSSLCRPHRERHRRPAVCQGVAGAGLPQVQRRRGRDSGLPECISHHFLPRHSRGHSQHRLHGAAGLG